MTLIPDWHCWDPDTQTHRHTLPHTHNRHQLSEGVCECISVISCIIFSLILFIRNMLKAKSKWVDEQNKTPLVWTVNTFDFNFPDSLVLLALIYTTEHFVFLPGLMRRSRLVRLHISVIVNKSDDQTKTSRKFNKARLCVCVCVAMELLYDHYHWHTHAVVQFESVQHTLLCCRKYSQQQIQI